MTIETVLGAVGVILLLGGCALATIGLFGLILKPNIFDQLHAAGLVTGPGVVLVLLASVGTGRVEIITSAIVVAGFVLITSSISTHAIAHSAARRYGVIVDAAAAAGARDGRLPTAAAATDGRDGPEDQPSSGLRVVVGHDESAGADLAARLAASIEWPPGTVLRLVRASADHALPPIEAGAGRMETGPEHEATADALRDVARSIERPGVTTETLEMHGDPADVIADEADAFRADLLITGSRRRGFVDSLFGSSATGAIVDRAPCPVLVARSEAVRVVLLATDGSPESAAVVEIVASWPIFDLARIRVVSVAQAAAAPRRGLRASLAASPDEWRAVDMAAARLMDAGRDVDREVLRGRPATEIVEAAREHAADLIVIGTRGRTGLGRSLLGSVAGEVLASAGCSVLIVGPPPRRPPSAR